MRALIIIDMLNDFVDGQLANPKAQAIVEPLQRLLAHAREHPILESREAGMWRRCRQPSQCFVQFDAHLIAPHPLIPFTQAPPRSLADS